MLLIPPGKAPERAVMTGSPRAAGASAAGRGLRRGLLRGLTAVVAVGLLGSGVAGAAAASAGTRPAAGPGHCTRTVTGTHHGVLVAGYGVLCLDRATQYGPVRVWPGAGLTGHRLGGLWRGDRDPGPLGAGLRVHGHRPAAGRRGPRAG